MFSKNKVAMLVAEFVGTFALTSAVFAAASTTTSPFFGGAAAGLTLAVLVLIIGMKSGAHVNPAVTLGLWSVRKFPTSQAIVYIAVQMLGGLTALRVNEYLTDQVLENTAAAAWDWRVATAEIIGTFIFTFGIAAAVYGAYEGGKLAAAIGGSLFVGVLIASFASIGALNPALALGVNSWSAAYVIAPLLGAILGMNTYALLFAPEKAARKKR